MQQLIEASRPLWQRVLRWLGDLIMTCYLINAAVWLAVAPLVPPPLSPLFPSGFDYRPAVVFFSSIALLTGFAMLLIAHSVVHCYGFSPGVHR